MKMLINIIIMAGICAVSTYTLPASILETVSSMITALEKANTQVAQASSDMQNAYKSIEEKVMQPVNLAQNEVSTQSEAIAKYVVDVSSTEARFGTTVLGVGNLEDTLLYILNNPITTIYDTLNQIATSVMEAAIPLDPARDSAAIYAKFTISRKHFYTAIEQLKELQGLLEEASTPIQFEES